MNNYFDNRFPTRDNGDGNKSIEDNSIPTEAVEENVPVEAEQIEDTPTTVLSADAAPDAAPEAAPAEAEHVISYRDDESERPSSYHMTGDRLVKDEMTTERHGSSFRPEPAKNNFPPYGTPRYDGNGNVFYTPAPEKKEKKKNGTGKRVALVLLCMILSFGCGIGGSFAYNVMFGGADAVSGGSNNNKADSDDAPVDNTVVVQRPVEHVESSSEGSALTYTDVENLVGDSVVAITTEYKVVSYWQEYVTGGAGSGVVMSEDGYIITNYHVVSATNSYNEYADSVKVSFKNGNEYDAEIIGGDPNMDIAVIKIVPEEDDKLVPAVFADSDKLKVGEEVIAIGNPLGELSGTTTNGIISALAREVVIEDVTMNLLQTNAAINPGNSGGGLFNMSGELIGVVNAKSSGTGIEGLGFAIPSNDALETATAIIENGGNIKDVADVKVGIRVVTINTAELAREYGVNAYGVYVDYLEEGYNDDVLKVLDRIIAVDGVEIATGDDVVAAVRAAKAGDTLEFMIYRNGRLKSVDVTVYENPEAK